MSNASVWPRVVGLLALGAVVGLGAGALTAQGSDEPPAGRPSASPTATGATPGASGDATATEEPEDGVPVLEASVDSVGANERFELGGSFPGAEPGTELRVQRRLDGGDWTDFPEEGDPVTADVGDDGTFAVEVASGRQGPNEWRVQDPGTDAASEPVTVTVG